MDYLVRQGQDGQTVGIPIGPDTSLVISELLMHNVDKNLIKELPNTKGHRFIDDYELSFLTRDEAERAFYILNSNLSEFELALNTKKTHIVSLPVRSEEKWVTELRRFEIRNLHDQANDLEAYFSLAFDLYNKHPNESVLQWAISCLRSINIRENNWKLFQQLLMLCITPEPACLPFVLEQILLHKKDELSILKHELSNLLNKLIITHSELRHSSEVANALWGCLALNLRINEQAVNKVSFCRDSCVALLALDCEKKGLTDIELDKTTWEEYLNTESLYGEQWLLAYEASVKGWLVSKKDPDYVEKDANFRYLKENNVSFYKESTHWDSNLLPTTPARMPYD